MKQIWIYKPSHGYFKGYINKKTSPCINSSAWAENTFAIMIHFPSILHQQRSEEGKKIRRLYKNDVGVPYRAVKCLMPRTDGISPTITTFHEGTQIMTTTNTTPTTEYKEHPTKEDLLEYFGQRIRVRKMTPRTALRLMDVEDGDIDKMMCATETVVLKDGTAKVRKAISKTVLYKLAGNSIVVSCLYHIFRTLFIPGQPENETVTQPTLFD